MLARDLEHVAVSTGHELVTDVHEDVWCLGDDARILQIGRALVTNALTHTPAGTRVTLHARRRRDRAELSVEDDGPGIPPSQREAVFGRFYRVEGGMASGSGLGLAIAREIARVIGGEVRLDSPSGPTVFTLDLPGEPAPTAGHGATRPFSRENTTADPARVTQG
jgi:two-component system OmpR family sensor kinase